MHHEGSTFVVASTRLRLMVNHSHSQAVSWVVLHVLGSLRNAVKRKRLLYNAKNIGEYRRSPNSIFLNCFWTLPLDRNGFRFYQNLYHPNSLRSVNCTKLDDKVQGAKGGKHHGLEFVEVDVLPRSFPLRTILRQLGCHTPRSAPLYSQKSLMNSAVKEI